MAAELPIFQQVLRATVNASRLHPSKLAPSEALRKTAVIFLNGRVNLYHEPAARVAALQRSGSCVTIILSKVARSACVRTYFAQRAKTGQNQGNHRARRRSRHLSRAVHAHRSAGCSVCGARLWRLAV